MTGDNGLKNQPLYFINAAAPIRICDNGGWTDTWFAHYGSIFNIGVSPFSEVQIAAYPSAEREYRIIINAQNYGERYAVDTAGRSSGGGWGRHPLLEAAVEYMRVPDDLAIEVSVFSKAPSGASTGTSASVTVAVIGALDRLTPGNMTPLEAAYAAHKVETEMLGQQCGIQDQLCSAFGGINYIEMGEYPRASVSQIQLPDALKWELERRLVLIYLGRSHQSSDVHEMVIQSLEEAGPDCPQLEALRQTAPRSRDAIRTGDFAELGRVMVDNNEAQRDLHPSLISEDAERVIAIAREHGALGWKVNGAGGEGGSLTLLCGPRSDARRAMIGEIESENSLFRNISISLSRAGLRVWKNKTTQ